MSYTADDIVERIMQNAVTEASVNSGNALKRYHVSQTADQLPDFRARKAYYRSELERQIQEKREAEKKRKEFEILEEERLYRKIEADREKLRREYLDEIEKRNLMLAKRQNPYDPTTVNSGKGLHQQDEAKRRQQAIAKRLEEIQQAEEKKREEEAIRKKRQIYDHLYKESKSSSYYNYSYNRHQQKPWNSRDYVHSALRLSLEDIYEQAPLPLLADVYKKLDFEKTRMKEIIRRRITDGEI